MNSNSNGTRGRLKGNCKLMGPIYMNTKYTKIYTLKHQVLTLTILSIIQTPSEIKLQKLGFVESERILNSNCKSTNFHFKYRYQPPVVLTCITD